MHKLVSGDRSELVALAQSAKQSARGNTAIRDYLIATCVDMSLSANRLPPSEALAVLAGARAVQDIINTLFSDPGAHAPQKF